jgi:hypothetical protein
MNQSRIVMNAYIETLYERLNVQKIVCIQQMRPLLQSEIAEQRFDIHRPDKFDAYLEACVAFLDERLESYNPIGLQWTFPQTTIKEAFEMEAIVDWYDSRDEFDTLCQRIKAKLQSYNDGACSEEVIGRLADELIAEHGAYPNQSIIETYRRRPQKNHLPDLVVATAIEATLKKLT